MPAVVLKRPRADSFGAYSLSTIHPVLPVEALKPRKLLRTKAPHWSEIEKAATRAASGYEQSNVKSSSNNKENTKSNKVSKRVVVTSSETSSPAVAASTQKDVDVKRIATWLLGFQTEGILSHIGASNAVSEPLLPVVQSRGTQLVKLMEMKNTSSEVNKLNFKPVKLQTDSLAHILKTNQSISVEMIVSTIQKVPFLDAEQKEFLTKQINNFCEKHGREIQQEQFQRIYQYLNTEQDRYLRSHANDNM